MVDNESKSAEVEYMILPEFWNQGYGTVILLELLDLCQNAEIKTVEDITGSVNIISKHILEKNGFFLQKEFINDDGEPAVLYRCNTITEKTYKLGK